MKSVLRKNYVYGLYDVVKSSVKPLRPGNQTEKTRALFAVALVSVLWGTTWLASKRGVEDISVFQMLGTRHLIGGFLYITYFSFKGFKLPTKEQFIQFTWMAVVLFVISNGLSAWSVKYVPSGLGAVVGAISPIWIAIFSVMFFKSARLNKMTVLGFILGFAGILIIFYDYLDALFNSRFTLGIVMGVVATMAWALGTIYTVKHAQTLNPYYSLGWQMLISGIILTAIAFFSGQFVPLPQVSQTAWLAILYLVIVGSIITFAAFIYSLKRLPAAQASVYAYINPIVAVIIGAILNKEKLNAWIAIGTVITLIGVFLVNTGFRKGEKG